VNPVPVDVGVESPVSVLITGITDNGCVQAAGCSCFVWDSLWYRVSVPPMDAGETQCVNITSQLSELRWEYQYSQRYASRALVAVMNANCEDPLFPIVQTLATNDKFNTTMCFMAREPLVQASKTWPAVFAAGATALLLYAVVQSYSHAYSGHTMFVY
jgi:hypothetical protein